MHMSREYTFSMNVGVSYMLFEYLMISAYQSQRNKVLTVLVFCDLFIALFHFICSMVAMTAIKLLFFFVTFVRCIRIRILQIDLGCYFQIY